MVYEALKNNFTMVKPGGAFYFFPGAPGGDADGFVDKVIEHKVFIIPGNVFSQRNTHFRISFAVDEEKLKRAIDILNEIVIKYY